MSIQTAMMREYRGRGTPREPGEALRTIRSDGGPAFRPIAFAERPSYDAWMPTVLRSGPYRFFFYAGDREEPPHVHVERDDNTLKAWLSPLRLEYSRGYRRVEINRVLKLVESHRQTLLDAWNAYFFD